MESKKKFDFAMWSLVLMFLAALNARFAKAEELNASAFDTAALDAMTASKVVKITLPQTSDPDAIVLEQ